MEVGEMKRTSWIWIGVLAIGLAACAGQPSEEPEPAAKDEPATIATEDFDSGEADTVVETIPAEEAENPDAAPAPDPG
jgi:ABC-type glycerol-3-phosphate transport system substrate-binding protein